MDIETIWSLLTVLVIGVLSYFALKMLRCNIDTKSMLNLKLDDTKSLKKRKHESCVGKSGTEIDRISQSTTNRMRESSTDNIILEVPSRQIIEKESSIENASDNFTRSDSETEGDDLEDNEEEDDYKAFEAFVDEEKLKGYTDELGVIRGLMKYIDENLQTWMTRKLKIAIIGNSGTGKSSLINAIRGLKPEDKGAARVGVTETTLDIQEYVLPSNENISLWDLPGVGTQYFKKKDYLKAVKLKEFDVFMIVSASRFTENDIWLATEILKLERYIFFLRTKIDFDVSNEKNDHRSTYKEADCLQKIRQEILNNLRKAKFPHKGVGIYLVSSKQWGKYDFPNLLKRLNGILSKKRFALKGVLEHQLQNILSRKRDQKKRQFLLEKVALFFGIGFVDTHTRRMYDKCKMSFSLDDKTLEMISDEIGMPMTSLKTEELKFFKDFEAKMAQPVIFKLIPVLVKISYGVRIFTDRLEAVCDALAIDEAKLVSLRLNHLEKQLEPL